jgi:hypothetical protein
MRRRLLSFSLAAFLSLTAAAPLAAAPPNDDREIGLISRITKIVRALKRTLLPNDELNIPHP